MVPYSVRVKQLLPNVKLQSSQQRQMKKLQLTKKTG